LRDLECHDYRAEYEDLRRRSVPGISVERLTFAIMHGNGNVIMVVDESLSGLSPRVVAGGLARDLCGSFRSLRVDGIAFVRSTTHPVRMTYFECDGTHSQMCGNALRCVTRYGADLGYLCVESDVVATDDGPKWVSAAGGTVRVAIGRGREFQEVARDRYFVFSGLPHLVLLLGDGDDIDACDVKTEGAALRYDEQLCRRLNHPEGLHVDFMQRHRDDIRIRTYEVGVEDETSACGTGAVGSAYVAHRIWQLPYPIRVVVAGGEMRVEDADEGLLLSGVTSYLFSTLPASAGA
jgi:diaminopimelate epimerase